MDGLSDIEGLSTDAAPDDFHGVLVSTIGLVYDCACLGLCYMCKFMRIVFVYCVHCVYSVYIVDTLYTL